MASTYSPSLRLELMATGDQSGTWGDTTNTNLGTLLEQAITGYAAIAQGDVADKTLTNLNGASDEARNMIIEMTGALTAARNVVVPTAEKLYLAKNSTTGGFSLTFKTSAGTGVSVPPGAAVWVFCDGTNVVDGPTTVQYTPQTLTAAQQGQARANSGADLIGGLRNEVINGSFAIAQLGPTVVSPAIGAYSLDQWYTYDGSSATVTRSTSGPPMGDTYYLRSTQTATSFNNIAQPLEADAVNRLKGALVTVTAYIRRNGTFAGGLRVGLEKNATANTKSGTWTNIAGVNTANGAIPTGTGKADWLKVTFTATVPDDGTANGLRVVVAHTAPEVSGAYYEVGHVSLVKGDATTETDPFSPRFYQQEFQLCQRFFEKSFLPDTAPAQNAGIVSAFSFPQVVGASTVQANMSIPYKVPKRVDPTVTLYNPSAANGEMRNGSTASDCSSTAIGGTISDVNAMSLTATTPAGSAAGQQLTIHWAADARI